MDKFQDQPVRILTADDIWAVDDIEERVVPVPQWNGAVRIRTLSQKQANELRRRATRRNAINGKDEIDNDLLEALLFTEGVIEPQFTMADYGKLQQKSMAAMSLILREVMDASGLTDAAVREATKSPNGQPNVEVRILPGEGTEDDTG